MYLRVYIFFPPHDNCIFTAPHNYVWLRVQKQEDRNIVHHFGILIGIFSPNSTRIFQCWDIYNNKKVDRITAIYVSQHRYLYHRVSICVFVFVLCLRGRQLGGHRHVPRLPETIHPLVLNAPSLFQTPLGTIIRWVRELSNSPTVDLKSSPKLAYGNKENRREERKRYSRLRHSNQTAKVNFIDQKKRLNKWTENELSPEQSSCIKKKNLFGTMMIHWLVFTGGMLFLLLAYVEKQTFIVLTYTCRCWLFLYIRMEYTCIHIYIFLLFSLCVVYTSVYLAQK